MSRSVTATEKMATCHPDKFAFIRGLCRTCYDNERWAAKPYLKEKKLATSRLVNRRWYEEHGAEARARQREDYAARGYAFKRDYTIKWKYGITLEQFAKMEADQKGLCAICHLPPKNTDRRTKHLCVDHDWKTGRVRGLLCYSCNAGIGMLAHDVSFLASAILYLERTE